MKLRDVRRFAVYGVCIMAVDLFSYGLFGFPLQSVDFNFGMAAFLTLLSAIRERSLP